MDRVGRKLFILVGGVVTLLGYVSYSFAKAWFLLRAGIMLVSLDSAIRGTVEEPFKQRLCCLLSEKV